jgi:hypothetical protein
MCMLSWIRGLNPDGIIRIFVWFFALHHTVSHGSCSDTTNAICVRSSEIVKTGILHPRFSQWLGNQAGTSITKALSPWTTIYVQYTLSKIFEEPLAESRMHWQSEAQESSPGRNEPWQHRRGAWPFWLFDSSIPMWDTKRHQHLFWVSTDTELFHAQSDR